MRTILSSILILLSTFIQAQNALKLQAAIPALLRNGDRLELQLSIYNAGNKDQTGQAELQLTDAQTGVSIDGWFQNVFPNQYFTADANGTAVASFPIEVPYQFFKQAAWRFIVRTETDSLVSSGRLTVLPVLAPFAATALFEGSGQFTFAQLAASEGSESLQHASLQVQLASSPAALAYPALAALLEREHTTLTDLAGQYVAAAYLLKGQQQHPKAFQQFRETTPALLQQKLATLEQELLSAQQNNGGFAPVKGGKADAATTWLVAIQLAQLQQLRALASPGLQRSLQKAMLFLGRSRNNLPPVAVAYLESLAGKKQPGSKAAVWISSALGLQPRWMQAMTAVLLQRLGKSEQAGQVFKLAVQEQPTTKEPSPLQLSDVTTNSLLLEYARLTGDTAAIRVQTNRILHQSWNNNFEFTGAAYALLLNSSGILPIPEASIRLGNLPETSTGNALVLDTTLEGSRIQPSLHAIAIRQQKKGPLFTRLHWQYFDQPDTSSTGHVISSSWQLVDGGQSEALNEGLRVVAGDELELVVTVDVQATLGNVLLSAGIPAGCISERQQASAPLSLAAQSYTTTGTINWIIPELPLGKHRFTCRMKAVHKGSFATGAILLQPVGGDKTLARQSGQILWVE